MRRDRGALVMSFVLPMVFFSIFAVIFGGSATRRRRSRVIVVDEDQSDALRRAWCKGLESDGSLW